MSPAHGTLIKISNCMHLCLLAGLLKRQRPHHPSLPPPPWLWGIMFAIRRHGLANEWPFLAKKPSLLFSHLLFRRKNSPYFKRGKRLWENVPGALDKISVDQKWGPWFYQWLVQSTFQSLPLFSFERKWILLSLKHHLIFFNETCLLWYMFVLWS